jgi:hypothetical protein
MPPARLEQQVVKILHPRHLMKILGTHLDSTI